MIDNPLVSVLMVSYNSATYIREAIESVLSQTYLHLELVICDDNSTDDTWSIVCSFNDDRIRMIRNQVNLGEYENRNKIVTLAKGEYLIFIDADDLIYTHGIDFMMKYAKEFPDSGMVISRPWDERIIFPKTISPEDFYRFEFLDSGVIGINFTKILFRSEVIRSVRPFPADVKFGDFFIQFEIALKHTSVLIPDASTWWRRRSGQASEKLLQNHSLYLLHELWIKLDKLNDEDCPLNENEKEIAFLNIYGNYTRYLLRETAKLKIGRVVSLLKAYPVPFKYWRSLWTKQQRSFFNRYSGDFPLREAKA